MRANSYSCRFQGILHGFFGKQLLGFLAKKLRHALGRTFNKCFADSFGNRTSTWVEQKVPTVINGCGKHLSSTPPCAIIVTI